MILSKYAIEDPQFLSLSEIRSNRFAMATIRVGGQSVQLAAIHLTKPYFDDYHTIELRRASMVLRERGGPVVIGGDFNSDTIAPDMQEFLRRNALQTAGTEPATWPVAAGIFGIPIDHIYVSKDIVPLSLTRLEDAYGSNHYGLIGDLALIVEH
jgi:endonuclease/exonuclease/phosphatase (EEP) superfamily protein YafD